MQKETERLLLTGYAPASILVDQSLNFHGETGRYLKHAHGAASLNPQKVCRAGLLVELSAAIREAQTSELPTLREGMRVELADGGSAKSASKWFRSGRRALSRPTI